MQNRQDAKDYEVAVAVALASEGLRRDARAAGVEPADYLVDQARRYAKYPEQVRELTDQEEREWLTLRRDEMRAVWKAMKARVNAKAERRREQRGRRRRAKPSLALSKLLLTQEEVAEAEAAGHDEEYAAFLARSKRAEAWYAKQTRRKLMKKTRRKQVEWGAVGLDKLLRDAGRLPEGEATIPRCRSLVRVV